MECEEAYVLNFAGIEKIDAAEAWDKMMAADKERDLDDFRQAFKAYVLAVPEVDLADLQTGLRADHRNVYLVAQVSIRYGPSVVLY